MGVVGHCCGGAGGGGGDASHGRFVAGAVLIKEDVNHYCYLGRRAQYLGFGVSTFVFNIGGLSLYSNP